MTSAPKRSTSARASSTKSCASTWVWTISGRVSGIAPGLDSDTRLPPARAAAVEHSTAAPGISALPATTFTAERHLCASDGRRGHHRATSAASTTCRVAPDTSSPMSTTRTSPARSAPLPRSRPGLSAWNVTVRVARITPSPAAPVSASTPLGTSTASTGASPGSGAVHSPWKPVPKAASTTRSHGGSVAGHSSTGTTRTETPRRRRRIAAERPSAPLFPDPATTTTRRPYPPPSRSRASRATAAPARSISTSTGSGAASSMAPISTGVTTGIMSPCSRPVSRPGCRAARASGTCRSRCVGAVR